METKNIFQTIDKSQFTKGESKIIPVINLKYDASIKVMNEMFGAQKIDLIFDIFNDFSESISQNQLNINKIKNAILPISPSKCDYAFIFDNYQLQELSKGNYYEILFKELFSYNASLYKKDRLSTAVSIGDVISADDKVTSSLIEHLKNKGVDLDFQTYKMAGYSVLGLSNISSSKADDIFKWFSKTLKVFMYRIEKNIDEIIFHGTGNCFLMVENIIYAQGDEECIKIKQINSSDFQWYYWDERIKYKVYLIPQLWYNTFLWHDFIPSIPHSNDYLNISGVEIQPISIEKKEYLQRKHPQTMKIFNNFDLFKKEICGKILKGTIFNLRHETYDDGITKFFLNIFVYIEHFKINIAFETVDFKKFKIVTAV